MSFECANELLRESPRKARELALDILGAGSDPRRWLGFAIIGSSFRLEGRYPEAEAAFYLAACRRPADCQECEAEILGKAANLARERRDFGEAISLLKRKISLAVGEKAKGRASVELAIVMNDLAFADRQPALAHQLAAYAKKIFATDGDHAYLHAVAGLELVCAVEDDGISSFEIEELFEEFTALAPPQDGSLRAGQDAWLAGVVHRRLGRWEAGRQALESAISTFARLNVPTFQAVAALDLAAMELALGNRTRAASLCGELFPIFSALRSDLEAWAAARTLLETAGDLTLSHVQLAAARRAVLSRRPHA